MLTQAAAALFDQINTKKKYLKIILKCLKFLFLYMAILYLYIHCCLHF